MDFYGIDTSKPSKGNNFRLHISKNFFKETDYSITPGFYVAFNVDKRPSSYGVFAKYRPISEGIAFSIKTSKMLSICRTTIFHIKNNIFRDNNHTVNACIRLSKTTMIDGYCYNGFTLGLNYNNAKGYGIKVSTSRFWKFNFTIIDVVAKVNLWKSPNTAMTLDLSAKATRYLSGYYAGVNKFTFGIGFNQHF